MVYAMVGCPLRVCWLFGLGFSGVGLRCCNII